MGRYRHGGAGRPPPKCLGLSPSRKSTPFAQEVIEQPLPIGRKIRGALGRCVRVRASHMPTVKVSSPSRRAT
jgi:hypothetical protein